MAGREVIYFFLSKQAANGLRFPFNVTPSHRFEHSPPDL
jgi:hypothetical protein